LLLRCNALWGDAAPHLHFQLVDHNSLLESEGVPYAFDSFEVIGRDKKYEKRDRQLPMDGEIIRFSLAIEQ
jgi:hypothetical protein